MAHHAKKLLSMIKGLVLVGVAVLAIGDSAAYAASNEGPIHIDNDGTILIQPNNSYGNSFPTRGRGWDYVVSNDNYTDVWSSDILVYSTTPNPVIRIIGSDLCVNNNVNIRGGDVAYSPAMPTGRMVNEYRLYTFDPRPGATYGNGTSVAYDRGFWNYDTAATCHDNEVTLTPAGVSMIDPGTGRYIYRINALANRATGGQFANSFHVIAPTGAIVTQSSDPGFSGFGMQASYPVPDGGAPNTPNPPDPHRVYSDLFIPFGPDCTLTTPTATKSLIITDADNVGQYSVQPQPFRIGVQAFTQSTGASRGYVPLTWRDVGAGGAVDVSGNQTVWEPIGGNQTGVLFDFTVERGVVYRLVISRVYYNNTLEFRLPYDGAHFYLPCQQPTTVRPVVAINPPQLENGDPLSVTSGIRNVGTNPAASSVTYTRQIWSDTNRDSLFSPGERTFGGTPQSGTTSVPASPSAGMDFPAYTAVADTGIHGGRICVRLEVSASAPVTVQSSPAVLCVDIGKRPHLQIASGDAMVGGTFRDGAGVCPMPAADIKLFGSAPKTINAAVYSSFADFGVFSLGEIKDFGANGAAPGAASVANFVSYGNTPAPLGYFYSSGAVARGNPQQARCLNDPFASFGPKATTNNGSATIDVATLGSDTSATANGTVTLTSSRPLPAGYRRVIYVKNATQVTISQNITYADGPYASIDQIPQIVVLSNQKMVVNGSVTRLDGLYATGTDFQTCEVAPRLTQCNQQLTVNGALIAGGNVLPYRTFGAQAPNYGDKAEIFRLRPDVLLNQLPVPGGQTYIRTMDQREVPARF